MIAAYLKVDPRINDRHLGDIIGVSKNTVADERQPLEQLVKLTNCRSVLGVTANFVPASTAGSLPTHPRKRRRHWRRSRTCPLVRRQDPRRDDRCSAGTQPRQQAGMGGAGRDAVCRRGYSPLQLPVPELEAAAGIVPASVHAIITDILYDGPFLPQVSELAEFAKRVLVPGGLLVTLSGTLYVDQVMKRLGEHLDWGWMGSSTWDGDGTLVHPRQVMSQWKPILVYSNGKWKERGMWPDVFRINSKEKDWHLMQQPLEEAEKLVNYFSQPGDLVVDTCGGGFTIAVACKNLGRRFIGCDVSAECVSKGQARLAGLSSADWERANQHSSKTSGRS